MNAPTCRGKKHIDFLVVSSHVVSGMDAVGVRPNRSTARIHDALTRHLYRLDPDPATLWGKIAPHVDRASRVLFDRSGSLYVDELSNDLPARFARFPKSVSRRRAPSGPSQAARLNYTPMTAATAARLREQVRSRRAESRVPPPTTFIDDEEARWTRRDSEVDSDVSLDTM